MLQLHIIVLYNESKFKAIANPTILWITFFLKTGARRPVPSSRTTQHEHWVNWGVWEFGELENSSEYEVYYDEDHGPLQWYK